MHQFRENRHRELFSEKTRLVLFHARCVNANKSSMPFTVVTALYDLSGFDGDRPKPVAQYLPLALEVLKLQAPMVIFTHGSTLVEFFQKHRQGKPTSIIERSLEEMPLRPHVEAVKTLVGWNEKDRKNTAMYRFLTWSKFAMVDEISRSNPFGSEAFCWIDIGISHITGPPVMPLVPVDNKFHVLSLCHVVPDTAHEIGTADWSRVMAGGFWYGSAGAVQQVARTMQDKVIERLQQGHAPLEENILAWLAYRQPEWFRFYYGDYASLFCNIQQVHTELNSVWFNLEHCVRHRQWALAYRISGLLLTGAIRLKEDQEAYLHRIRTRAVAAMRR